MRDENEWFKPERLKVYLFLYEAILVLLLATGIGVAWYVDGFAEVPDWLRLGGAGVILLVLAAFTWYIPTFYRTATYRLGDEELEYRRGVFYQQKTTVPYNRITNVSAYQGPIQRIANAGSVGVHTAGFGGQMGAELTITSISDYDDVKDQLLAKVRGRRPVATEGADETRTDAEPARPPADAASGAMLDELRRIRELLESQRAGGGKPPSAD